MHVWARSLRAMSLFLKASRYVIVLIPGAILTPFTEPASGDPFPHSMEPQLRALGLATTLIRGVPSLSNPHTICVQGEKLSSEKCRILKLLGVQMAVSRNGVRLLITRSSVSTSARDGPRELALYRATTAITTIPTLILLWPDVCMHISTTLYLQFLQLVQKLSQTSNRCDVTMTGIDTSSKMILETVGLFVDLATTFDWTGKSLVALCITDRCLFSISCPLRLLLRPPHRFGL